jgi:hypothetical protein
LLLAFTNEGLRKTQLLPEILMDSAARNKVAVLRGCIERAPISHDDLRLDLLGWERIAFEVDKPDTLKNFGPFLQRDSLKLKRQKFTDITA